MPSEIVYDFFVSYASADNGTGWVDEFVKVFVNEHRAFSGGRTLTYFLDRDRIPHFSHWHAEIFNKGLAKSRFFLAFLSPNYLASDVCRREWRAWIEQEIALHILAEGASPIYFVEVPGLLSKPPLSEHELAAKVAELCHVPALDRLTADLAAMVRELRRRQLLDLVQPFHNSGVKALQAADTQATLRKLAQHLDARVEETKRADASADTVPPYNPRFSGRLDELLEIRTLLTDNRTGVIAGIHGLGGIGKTELAYTYAHAFAGVYPGGRFEVKCENQTHLRDAINIALGGIAPFQLHITDDERKHPDHLFAAIKRCLKQRLDTLGSVLLVLDNVSHTELLRPQETDTLTVLGSNLHLLATTRNVASLGVKSLVLGELKPADALAVMEKYRLFADAAEEAAAGRIVAKLGGFALAVELVAAKLAVTPSATYGAVAGDLGLDDLDMLAEQTDVQLRRHNHEKRLAAVLGPTLASLTPEQRRALDYAALLPPDNVPLPWLKTLLTADFPELAKATKWGDPWKEVVCHLVKLGVFTPVQEETTNERQVKVHRLVQELLRREMVDDVREEQRERVDVTVKARIAGLRALTSWAAARWELVPLEGVAWLWDDAKHPRRVWLMNQIGLWLMETGEYQRSERLFVRCVQLEEAEFGTTHTNVATALNNLAELYNNTSRFTYAEPLFRRVVAIDESSAGPETLNLAIGLNNLGRMLCDVAQYEEAEKTLRRSLAIRESHRGSSHPDVATAANSLAILLQNIEKDDEAEEFFRRAVEITESASGPVHINVACYSNNLAELLLNRGRPEEAEQFFRRAISITETVLGPNHPHVATVLNNLGDLLRRAGRFAEAERVLQRALEISQSSFGADNPAIAVRLYNLALIYDDSRRFTEAEPLYRRAYQILSRCYGEHHPRP